MSLHCCPECDGPMAMVNLLQQGLDKPQLASFYCRECGFVDTAAVSYGGALICEGTGTVATH